MCAIRMFTYIECKCVHHLLPSYHCTTCTHALDLSYSTLYLPAGMLCIYVYSDNFALLLFECLFSTNDIMNVEYILYTEYVVIFQYIHT